MIEEKKCKESYKNFVNKEDTNVLRPSKLDEFIGQDNIKNQLKVYIESAKRRNKTLDHILIYGPAGLGKTTLSSVIANELGSNIKIVSAQVFVKNGDIASLLSSLKNNDVLFIDEIHRLKVNLEEVLFPAMEDFKLDILIGSGVNSRTMRINLPHFTLIGATTKVGNISKPLQTRFGIIIKMDYYDDFSLSKIVQRAANILNINIEDDASAEIGKRSRGTPRIAIRLLKRIYDFSIYMGKDKITKDVVNKSLEEIGIDVYGLDSMDRRMLSTICNDYCGGPVGLATLAINLSEDKKTIEEFYEPYLIQKGFLKRTQKGRIISEKGLEYLAEIGLINNDKIERIKNSLINKESQALF
ncbi:MAG: Holliday junction branch migration DNA helicase RuvB [Spirochaetes bacterium]|nr:Holliday junction branch migration DNA helicase RuvB [Spirochaetota bacterium]